MTFVLILNVAAVSALLLLLTATMRLPYRLNRPSRVSSAARQPAAERSASRALAPAADLA